MFPRWLGRSSSDKVQLPLADCPLGSTPSYSLRRKTPPKETPVSQK